MFTHRLLSCTHSHTCACVFTHISTPTHVLPYSHVHTSSHTRVCTQMITHVHSHMHALACTHNIHMYAHILKGTHLPPPLCSERTSCLFCSVNPLFKLSVGGGVPTITLRPYMPSPSPGARFYDGVIKLCDGSKRCCCRHGFSRRGAGAASEQPRQRTASPQLTRLWCGAIMNVSPEGFLPLV